MECRTCNGSGTVTSGRGGHLAYVPDMLSDDQIWGESNDSLAGCELAEQEHSCPSCGGSGDVCCLCLQPPSTCVCGPSCCGR